MPQQQWCSIWDGGAELPGLVAISSLGDVVLVNKMPAAKYNRTQGVTPWLCEHTEDLTADRTHLVEMHTRFTSSVLCKKPQQETTPVSTWWTYVVECCNSEREQAATIHNTVHGACDAEQKQPDVWVHMLYIPFQKKLKDVTPLKMGHSKSG